MNIAEFSCLMRDGTRGSLSDEFSGIIIERIVKEIDSAATASWPRTRDILTDWVEKFVIYYGVDSAVSSPWIDETLEYLQWEGGTDDSWDVKKLATLMKSAMGNVFKTCQTLVYEKCKSLSRLDVGSEAELRLLADQYLADLNVRISDGSRPAKDMVSVCEETGKSKLVREVYRRSEALSAIFSKPTLDGTPGDNYGMIFSSVRNLMVSACDPLIVDGEFSGELAEGSTDVYVVKMREAIFRSWAPQKTLSDCFSEMVDVWVSARKGDAGWLWKLVGDGVAVEVLITYGHSTWDRKKGGGPVQAWGRDGSLITY